MPARNISVTPIKYDLMEFFDDSKNWGATEVKSGRSWKKEELRLKSNADLHKLWSECYYWCLMILLGILGMYC
jgi:hypothetical protein